MFSSRPLLSRRRLLGGAAVLAAIPLTATLASCATSPRAEVAGVQPLGQTSFAAYAAETRAWVNARRKFVSDDPAAELRWNTPSEPLPAGDAVGTRGILLIHGLGDSPWSFVDQARTYANAGWLVRTVLLPGCGTRPEDMLEPTADDWRRVVREQAEILDRDLKTLHPGEKTQVWLGGFSTGCNLAIEFASRHEWISGLVLFSPAVEVRTHLAFMAPILAPFINWLREPEDSMMGGQTPFRYTIVPVQALAAFVDTMRSAEDALLRKPFDRPAVIMMSEHDSVVNTQALLETFPKRFTNPRTRILWYGSQSAASELSGNDPRVVVRSDYLPDENITSFSHMGLLYSPENPQYGKEGLNRLCRLGEDRTSTTTCRGIPAKDIHYGAWGDKKRTGVTARLTFNPWFTDQEKEILSVMNG